jgi:hypothetical protein
VGRSTLTGPFCRALFEGVFSLFSGFSLFWGVPRWAWRGAVGSVGRVSAELSAFVGCLMVASGFVSVVGSRRRAGVVARVVAGGRLVWARRALPTGPGWHPAPACLFVPVRSPAAAGLFAGLVRSRLGWRAVARLGSAGSPVWSAVGLPVPAFAVKVCLPGGVSVAVARGLLRPLACLAGVFGCAG